MNNNAKAYRPHFLSSDDEIAYLKRKISFLLAHAEELANRITDQEKLHRAMQLKELEDIKRSRSWRITRPLRAMNRILDAWKRGR